MKILLLLRGEDAGQFVAWLSLHGSQLSCLNWLECLRAGEVPGIP